MKETTKKIASIKELKTFEEEILSKIKDTKNGGNLYSANPFLFLEKIMNFTLSEEVKKEIKEVIPMLSTVSEVPFNAILKSKYNQPIQKKIKKLIP